MNARVLAIKFENGEKPNANVLNGKKMYKINIKYTAKTKLNLPMGYRSKKPFRDFLLS